MVLTIRKATIEDWQSVQKLNHEVFQVSYKFDKNLNMNWPFSPEGVAYYKKAIESESYFCHIAEADEVSVGYIIGVEQTFPYRANRTGEIENIGVTSKFRGKGIGKKLVNEFKKWCKNREVNIVRVSTYFHYPEAINFYKKNGLSPIDIFLEGPVDQ